MHRYLSTHIHRRIDCHYWTLAETREHVANFTLLDTEEFTGTVDLTNTEVAT